MHVCMRLHADVRKERHVLSKRDEKTADEFLSASSLLSHFPSFSFSPFPESSLEQITPETGYAHNLKD